MNNYDRFFEMLNKVPAIADLWDVKRRSLKLEEFEQALGVMSSGEAQMAKFFASVWFHHNEDYGFDLVHAVSQIDLNERRLIVEWIAKPFYP